MSVVDLKEKELFSRYESRSLKNVELPYNSPRNTVKSSQRRSILSAMEV